jgi:single-strand DNA-binding protein
LGEVGQAVTQKILKSGRAVTIFSVGTGGMHLSRRMFDGETPEEFAKRSNVQWHRVAVYQEQLGNFILHSMKQGYVAANFLG